MKEKMKQFRKEIIGGLVLFVGIVAVVIAIVLGQNQEKASKTKVAAAQSTEKESVSAKGGKKEEKKSGAEDKEKKAEAANKKEAEKEEKKESKKEESKPKEEAKKEEKTTVAANGAAVGDKKEEKTKEKAQPTNKEEKVVKEEKRPPSPAKEEVKHSHTWVTNYKTVTVPAVTKTVHHDAVYENRYVVDSPARTEEITEGHYFSVLTGEDLGTDENYAMSMCEILNSSYTIKSVVIGTREIPEQGHYESVLVQGAYDEEIIVSPETTKEVADGQICSGCGARR